MEQFDLVVLGTGAGGSSAALKCRAAGWRVASIDDQLYGGTCAVRGCDPKKVLVGAAEIVAWQNRMQGYGVTGHATIEWPELMRFKRAFTDSVPENRESALMKAGIETMHGEASFVAEDRVRLGSREIVAKHLLIATGAGPRSLNIPGENLLITSTQFLELDRLPSRIAFVGVGYVSLEFAHIARRAGCQVTLIGRSLPLPGFDAALVERLLAHTRELGIQVILDADVTQIEDADSPIHFESTRPVALERKSSKPISSSTARVGFQTPLDSAQWREMSAWMHTVPSRSMNSCKASRTPACMRRGMSFCRAVPFR